MCCRWRGFCCYHHLSCCYHHYASTSLHSFTCQDKHICSHYCDSLTPPNILLSHICTRFQTRFQCTNFFILRDPYLSSHNNKQYSCFSVSEIINTAIIPGKLHHMLNTHRSRATCSSNVNREPSFFQ